MLNQDNFKAMSNIRALLITYAEYISKHQEAHPADDPDNDRDAVRRMRIVMATNFIKLFSENCMGLLRTGVLRMGEIEAMLNASKRLLDGMVKMFTDGVVSEDDFFGEISLYTIEYMNDKHEETLAQYVDYEEAIAIANGQNNAEGANDALAVIQRDAEENYVNPDYLVGELEIDDDEDYDPDDDVDFNELEHVLPHPDDYD
jgi:hypothetical protein